jgi:hypothetical protein
MAELLRSADAGSGAAPAALREAFLELRPLQRGELLGACVALQPLAKATRDPGGSVYELRLSA